MPLFDQCSNKCTQHKVLAHYQHSSLWQLTCISERIMPICHRCRFIDISMIHDNFFVTQVNCPRLLCFYWHGKPLQFHKSVMCIGCYILLKACNAWKQSVHKISKTLILKECQSNVFGSNALDMKTSSPMENYSTFLNLLLVGKVFCFHFKATTLILSR